MFFFFVINILFRKKRFFDSQIIGCLLKDKQACDCLWGYSASSRALHGHRFSQVGLGPQILQDYLDNYHEQKKIKT